MTCDVRVYATPVCCVTFFLLLFLVCVVYWNMLLALYMSVYSNDAFSSLSLSSHWKMWPNLDVKSLQLLMSESTV